MTDETKPDPQTSVPAVEDAAELEETLLADSPDEEAEVAALSLEARALDGGVIGPASAESVDTEPGSVASSASRQSQADDNGASDAERIVEEPAHAESVSSRFRKGEWQQEFSAHKIAAELGRIETEVRQLLEEHDARRKRKFGGTRRWHELEDDILGLRFTGRADEKTLRLILQHVAQRHFLFAQLRFVASTRPTWNT